MPQIRFTQNIQRLVPCPTRKVSGTTLRHVYDLTFRHALDIDESGERLAFGSTTGSLWVSKDGGDSWKTISSNLPPVYCVRFEKGE